MTTESENDLAMSYLFHATVEAFLQSTPHAIVPRLFVDGAIHEVTRVGVADVVPNALEFSPSAGITSEERPTTEATNCAVVEMVAGLGATNDADQIRRFSLRLLNLHLSPIRSLEKMTRYYVFLLVCPVFRDVDRNE